MSPIKKHSYEFIKKKAHELLVATDQINDVPKDVFKVAKHLSFDLDFIVPGTHNLHIAGSLNCGDKCIYINESEPQLCYTFTRAHIIGYMLLNPNKDYICFRNRAKGVKELEADIFAGELLMPEEQFKKYWNMYFYDLYELSRTFNVTPIATAVRANHLGLGY